MSPLLFLAGLAAALAGEPDTPPEVPASARWRVGDLEVEGTLTRLGVDAEDATQLSAEWLPAMAAPERARREGRTAGWDFDVAQVWVTERSLADGRVVSKAEAAGTWRRPDPCASLGEFGPGPVELRAVAPPSRKTRGPLEENEHRRTLTVAETEQERLVLIGLQPGESATLIELVPPDDERPSRKARTRRRLSVYGADADLTLREDASEQAMCVHIHPPPEHIQVDRSERSLQEEVRAIRERLEREAQEAVPGDASAGEDGDDGVVAEGEG